MEPTNQKGLPLRDFYRDETYRHWLRLTAIAFVVMVVGSFVVGVLMPSLPEGIARQLTETMEEMGVADGDGRLLMLGLFLHNLQAMAVSMLLGLIPFIYLPALLLGTNAMVLGFVGAHYVNHGASLLIYLVGILPHGIFELPALVLSLSCGFYLCHCLTQRLRTKEKGVMRNAMSRVSQMLFLQIAPLLLAASFMEAYVTPAILRAMMG